MLAHGQHDVACCIGCQPIALGASLGEEEVDGGADGGVRGFRQPAGDGHHGPHAAEIAQRGEKRDVGLEETQRAHGLGDGLSSGDSGGHAADQRRKSLLRRRGERVMKARGVARDEFGQIRRGPEDAGEKLIDLGSGDECAERREAGLFTAPAGQVGKHVRRALAIVHDREGDDALVKGNLGQCDTCTVGEG